MKFIFETHTKIFEAEFYERKVAIISYEKDNIGNRLHTFPVIEITNKIRWIGYDFDIGTPTKEIDETLEKILKMKAFG